MSTASPSVPVLLRERRPLWDGGPTVSALTLGTSSFGSRVPAGEARGAIARALAAGIDSFDTSPLYGHGHSEGIVGRSLHEVDDVVVITKFGKDVAAGGVAARGLGLRGLVRPLVARSATVRKLAGRVFTQATSSGAFSADDARSSIERSLTRLDGLAPVVLFHSPTTEELRSSDAPELLRALVDEGRIRGFGVSVDDVDTAELALTIDGVRVLELPLSSWDRRFADSPVLARATAMGIGVLARSPFAAAEPGQEHRLPATLTPAQRAASLRLALETAGVSSVVCSASTPEHLAFVVEVANGGGPPPPPPNGGDRTMSDPRTAGTGTVANVVSYLRTAGLRQSAAYALYRVPVAREVYRRRRVSRAGQQLPLPLDDTIFPGHTPEALASGIRRDSYVGGLALPPDVLAEVQELCARSPLFVMRDGQKIVAHEGGRDELVELLGEVPVMAYVDCADEPLIRRIGDDPVLRDAFRCYFGYRPETVEPRLWWSFVVEASESERLSGQQTVLFHFDQHALNFLYANFYLTDVDLDSGAHVLVRGSHHRKPLRFSLSSAYKTDEAIIEHYGTQDLITITGPAGAGAIEDAWCYHKALPPMGADRLFLQFRYA